MIVEVPGMGDVEFPDDMSDEAVAAAIKQNMPQATTAKDPDPFAGDPLLSREAMSRLAAGDSSTVKPSPRPSPMRGAQRYLSGINDAAKKFNSAKPSGGLGTLEALGTLTTGGIAAPILGTAESAILGTSPEKSFARYTYQPRTESGKAQLGLLGAISEPLSASGADMALLPLAAEAQSIRGVKPLPKEKPEPIPTTAELKQAKNEAYAVAKEADVTVPADTYSKTLSKVRSMVKEEGIDPTLHPKSTAVIRRLNEAEGAPLTLQEAETLRKIALDAEDDLNPVTRSPTPDARLAGKIVDELDESIDALETNAPARAINARFRRSEMVDRMIRRAEIKAGAHYTQAGMEHSLRQEFKQLALNDRRMRFFTPEQRAAIEKVAKGGPVENTLRTLGKFDPTAGGMTSLVSLGTGTLAAGMTGNPAAMALPAAGFVGRRAATAMTKRNVDLARESLVGRGMPEVPAPVMAAPQSAGAASGQVMPRTPLALPSPTIIASSRSAPGTAYARQEMGLTGDVERAGALHPGVARESLMAKQPALQPALPLRPAPGLLSDQRPMVIDAAGRVAPNAERLREYLRVNGLDRMRNVRQPRAEPKRKGLLADEPNPVRRVAEIQQELQRVDAKAQRLPLDEPLDSQRMKVIAEEWERLQLELESAVSRASAK